jgi:sulfur-oxidizing protein SoxX
VILFAGTLAPRLNMPRSPPPLTPSRRAGEPPLSRGRAREEGNGTASPPVPLPPHGRHRVRDGARRGGGGIRGGGLLAACADINGCRLDRLFLHATLAAGALVFAIACAAKAEALRPYRVVGDAIPDSFTGAPGDPARGRVIVASRQTGLCLLCHSAPLPEEKFQGTIGPDLKGVGSRYTEGQLRLRILDSSLAVPGTIMPAYYRLDGLDRVAPAFRGKTVLTAEQIEDVVAFLKTLRDDTAR